MSPLGFNLRERGRRKDLLRQHSQHIKLGLQEEHLPQELQLSYIRYALLLIPVNVSINWSVSLSVSWSVVNASISHSVNQAISQSINSPTNHLSIKKCIAVLGLVRGVNRHLGHVCALGTSCYGWVVLHMHQFCIGYSKSDI